jgi:hypothetical protein
MDFRVVTLRDQDGVQIRRSGDTVFVEWDDRWPEDRASQSASAMCEALESNYGQRVGSCSLVGRTLTIQLEPL